MTDKTSDRYPSHARIYALASAKGGTGKTVLTATFGTILASIGKKVLLVDTDAATNGLSLFYLQKVVDRDDSREAVGLFESKSVPVPVKISENLDLVPTTYQFQNTDTIPLELYTAALANGIRAYGQDYDYILLDTQAGSDQYARVALSPRISDSVILVSEYDPMSAAGIERLKVLFDEELAFRRTWILLNKLLPDFVKSFSEFLEVARYLTPIPWNADVVRSYARQSLALDLVDGNEYTFAAFQALAKILPERDREGLEEWINTRIGSVRKSLDERINELETEIDLLREEQAIYRRRRITPFIAAATILMMAVVGGSLAVTVTTKQSTASNTAIIALSVGFAGILTVISTLFARSASEEDASLKARTIALESEVSRLRILRDMDKQASQEAMTSLRITR